MRNKNLLEVLKSDVIKNLEIEIIEWFTNDEGKTDMRTIDDEIGGYVLENDFEKLKEYTVDVIGINTETLKKANIHVRKIGGAK